MKIKNLQITSSAALDIEMDLSAPVCIVSGVHSALVLDLIREMICDYGAENDPDAVDDGSFALNADVEMDGKNYSVCYIRNVEYMGDHRISANFVPGGALLYQDDTLEYIEKCNARDKDTSNSIYSEKVFCITEDDRPLFVYCEDADDISQIIDVLLPLGRQVFIAARRNFHDMICESVQHCCVDPVI